MIDNGIDTIKRINFKRRARFLRNRFRLDAPITEEMMAKAFQETLARQATKTDDEHRVAEIFLDGAENEKITVERITDNFLELSVIYDFRIDTKLVLEQDDSDLIGKIKDLKFVFCSLSTRENCCTSNTESFDPFFEKLR